MIKFCFFTIKSLQTGLQDFVDKSCLVISSQQKHHISYTFVSLGNVDDSRTLLI